jgi:hypothetical protein
VVREGDLWVFKYGRQKVNLLVLPVEELTVAMLFKRIPRSTESEREFPFKI